MGAVAADRAVHLAVRGLASDDYNMRALAQQHLAEFARAQPQAVLRELGAALLNLFPLPNFTGTGARSRFNYQSAITAPENRSDLKMRFDYKLSDKTNMYLRLARESESDDAPYGIWWGPSTFELPSHLVGTNLGRSAAVNVTSVLSPTMTNEVVFSASKLKLNYDFNDPSKVSKSALGISNLQLPWGSKVSTPYAPLALISFSINRYGVLPAPGVAKVTLPG